jgi:hypothetical protein
MPKGGCDIMGSKARGTVLWRERDGVDGSSGRRGEETPDAGEVGGVLGPDVGDAELEPNMALTAAVLAVGSGAVPLKVLGCASPTVDFSQVSTSSPRTAPGLCAACILALTRRVPAPKVGRTAVAPVVSVTNQI